MTNDRLNLKVKIEPKKIGTKEINIRGSLLVANLIAEIQDHFSLDGTLALHPEKDDNPLNLNSPINETGIEEGGVLICKQVLTDTGTEAAIARGERIPFPEGFKRIYIEDKRTTMEYDLAWHPAILGRWDHRNPSNNRLLAADLESLEELPTVSRHHVAITLDEGKFFVEQLAARNPTYLDEVQLKPGRKYPLEAGAEIQMGRVTLIFNVLS